MITSFLTIIGGGLAGCEAAWQSANLGIKVKLYEMKPKKFSPIHRLEDLAELVCSNSLKSNLIKNASGLLKEELRILNSLIIKSADLNKVPAGEALAVDRVLFSKYITEILYKHPNIEIIREEIVNLPNERPIIIATGPLTSEKFSDYLAKNYFKNYLYFYDASSPIIDGDTIDYNLVFKASRYNKGGDDYINCPLSKEEYYNFVEELLKAEMVMPHPFEDEKVFEGCMPIEVLAKRGVDTLSHSVMKPVGLIDPKSGKMPYAVVQLRQENIGKSLYSLVGFQTKMKWKEQERVFRMIPGLGKAKFVRFGTLHRNTFINSPKFLKPTLQLKSDLGIFLAGQITGVEGYVESTGIGLIAGIMASLYIMKKNLVIPPPTTALGALIHYISNEEIKDFQPMGINFGIFSILDNNLKKDKKREYIVNKALSDIKVWKSLCGLDKVIPFL